MATASRARRTAEDLGIEATAHAAVRFAGDVPGTATIGRDGRSACSRRLNRPDVVARAQDRDGPVMGRASRERSGCARPMLFEPGPDSRASVDVNVRTSSLTAGGRVPGRTPRLTHPLVPAPDASHRPGVMIAFMLMRRLRISKGGQLSVPADIRHRWNTSRVVLEDLGDRLVIRPTSDDPVGALRGAFAGSAQSSSDELRRRARTEDSAAAPRRA